MRRTHVTAVTILGLAVPLMAAGTSYADEPPLRTPTAVSRTTPPSAPAPREVLARATAALTGEPSRAGGGREATLALRDLAASLPQLDAADRRRARDLLARPTQGADDPYGDGYRARATRSCSAKVCVHRVRRTSDKASAAWAQRTRTVLEKVWKHEVRRLGYRRPLRDGNRGGNGKFDVYLVDVGAEGLYGYCVPEYTARGNRRLASGYCVLDNDFARSQFGTRPISALKVTAAHEFFHAVQFAYDYLEDPWLMEATATWMEERFADAVNDNRQYLRLGQVRRTWEPLDRFDEDGAGQYGNWAFVEYLSMRFGTSVVKRIWKQAGELRDDGGRYSTRAVEAALPRRAPFPRVYADFQAANVLPARTYAEGEHWPRPKLADSRTLGPDVGVTGRARVHHMAGHHFRFRPGKGLADRSWRLRVSVDGPARRTSPRVMLVRLNRSGTLARTPVKLDAEGRGQTSIPFGRPQTKAVWVVVANASTRFDCRGRYVVGFSCGGRPKDDGRVFDLTMETWSRS